MDTFLGYVFLGLAALLAIIQSDVGVWLPVFWLTLIGFLHFRCAWLERNGPRARSSADRAQDSES